MRKRSKILILFAIISGIMFFYSPIMILVFLGQALNVDGSQIASPIFEVTVSTSLFAVFNLCISAILLIAGVWGGRCWEKPHKVESCYKIGVCALVLNGILLIISYLTVPSINVFAHGAITFFPFAHSLILICYTICAYKIKRQQGKEQRMV